MRKNRFQKNKEGFITVELLVAFVILTMVLTAVITLTFSSQSISVDSETNQEALSKAKALLEEAKARGKTNFFALANIGEVVDDIYRKTLNVEWESDYVKKIRSVVEWTAENNRQQQVELTTMVASWESAQRGDTCDPRLSGDWSNPQLLGDIDIVSNEGATDIDIRLKKVYLTTDPAAFNKEDFYIIEASDPSNPTIISKINTGNGLEAVRVAEFGDKLYAFAANRSVNGQLQIIDVTNPFDPQVKLNFKIPVAGHSTASCAAGFGRRIFFKNNRVYLGLYKTNNCPEFHIIDVSEPLNPQYLGGWEANTRINDIFIRDNIAFLATPQPIPNPPEEENLSVLNISEPDSIFRIPGGTFTATDAIIQSGNSFFLEGNTLYFGRTDGGSGLPHLNNKELFILDVSDISNINVVGLPQKIGSGVNGIVLRENFLFINTSDPNEEFQIWDISNPASPQKYASLNTRAEAKGGEETSVSSTTQQTFTSAFDCEGNLVYLGQRSNKALQIIGPSIPLQ